MTTAEINREVTRTIREFYYYREEGSNQYRDLEGFEETLMKDAAAISRKCNSLIGDARRNPAYDADMVARVVSLANRQEAKELADALATYKAERERFYNDEVDEVALQMSEAAE